MAFILVRGLCSVQDRWALTCARASLPVTSSGQVGADLLQQQVAVMKPQCLFTCLFTQNNKCDWCKAVM